MIQQINDFFTQFDFDVRKSKDARFMDQKVTPDVLCAVAECVMEFLGDDLQKEFTKNDIWHSDYAQTLITESFNKPNLKDATNEYDKFFAQPLKTLAYAKILNETKKGNTNIYRINRFDLLEYISLRERNALNFLEIYLSKIILESGLQNVFDNFFIQQNKSSLETLRNKLFEFYKTNTKVKKDNEPPRIFNKIINILAFKRRAKGSTKGSISEFSLPIEEIRYNRINWRDLGKDKGITREDFKVTLGNNVEIDGYYKYNVQKAKKFVRKIHSFSEIHRFEAYPGLQAHHIFMESEFPEIADYPENIICLTPNQHYFRAHPNNKTSVIDKSYQLICLTSKLDSIEINYRNGQADYSLTDFVEVLNIGFNTDHFKPEMDYEEIKHQIVKLNFQT
jgi:hypothetical protein